MKPVGVSSGRAQGGVRGQHAVVAMTVLARRRDEDGEAIQKFQGCQVEDRFPVWAGFGQLVDQALIRRVQSFVA